MVGLGAGFRVVTGITLNTVNALLDLKERIIFLKKLITSCTWACTICQALRVDEGQRT